MKRVSIVTIGNEILTGHTVNTNAAYLAERLLSIGTIVVSNHTVGDDVGQIVRTLKAAAKEADCILVTGGLGATSDDLTREAAAKLLGVKLLFRKELMEKIEDFFARRNVRMPENNKRQANLPAGTKVIENKIGSAPGFKGRYKGTAIYVMPGVPGEMKKMFDEAVLPEIKEKQTGKEFIVIRKVNCFGAGESRIAEEITDMCRRTRNPVINFTVSCGVVTLHITATGISLRQAGKKADEDVKILTKRLGNLVYGVGEESLAMVLGRRLAERKMTIATAESCTGGLIASMLTEMPGASEYFKYGWVTYSNDAKKSELGVPVRIIKRYGAVSEQTAEAMAEGARKKAKADIALAVTGIAGPTGGTKKKPIGLVYITVAMKGRQETQRFIFSGDRDFIRHRAAKTAFNMARLAILKIDEKRK
jgi:nicotinamide-nucleotide amidase